MKVIEYSEVRIEKPEKPHRFFPRICDFALLCLHRLNRLK
jgi:hypothetical protein